jgi:hypothetical protein
MHMEPKDAVLRYQFGERAKSELIIVSQLLMTLPDYKEEERSGGRKVLVTMMNLVRTEIDFAFNSTQATEFKKSINLLNEAISLTESNEWGAASVKIGESISAVTTVAQYAWQVLDEKGYI